MCCILLYSIKFVIMGTWAVAKHTYNEPGRDVTWTAINALVISSLRLLYSSLRCDWTAINALVISSDLCSVRQFHIFYIAMTLVSCCHRVQVFLPNSDIHVIMLYSRSWAAPEQPLLENRHEIALYRSASQFIFFERCLESQTSLLSSAMAMDF